MVLCILVKAGYIVRAIHFSLCVLELFGLR